MSPGNSAPATSTAVMTRSASTEHFSTKALLDLSPGQPAQQADFGCEFFPNIVEASSGEYFVEFFQRDRDGQRKGIVVINVEELEP
jgi:hypothetical protein